MPNGKKGQTMKNYKKALPVVGSKVLRGESVIVDGICELSIDEIISVKNDTITVASDNEVFNANGYHLEKNEQLFFIPEQFSAILLKRSNIKPSKVRLSDSGLSILKSIKHGVDRGQNDI